MYSCHWGGTVSSVVMASTGHASTHASQSMHSAGSMYSCSASAKPGSSGVGWMQSTGHTSTHEVSLVAMHGSLITYAIAAFRVLLHNLNVEISVRSCFCPLFV